VIVAGAAAVLASIYELYASPVGHQWFILAGLTVISGSATVKLPSIPASLSVSETFVFTSVLLFGAPAGTLTVALDGLIISLWLTKRRKELYRVLFNMAAPAISIWVSAKLFFLMAGIRPLVHQPAGISEFLLPLILFTILYFALNSWLIAWAVSFETREPASFIWRTHFLWLSLNFFCGASVAALLTVYPLKADLTKADLTFLTYLGAVLPLLFVLYLTYRTSMARVEDANKHLSEINEMYLSTIETLAMAIDAKDQVTHGHIRRVQAYAVDLAKSLGISDPGLIRAIEAASLLHDMGKLAVPEHILNKPGRLTVPEFEKMKLHASIGADILSAIHFPYPVIPIVRHHHENWDGSGYPSGLAGTQIPIGGRILAVVDCFDALTSDRPYRTRLSDEQAIEILVQRRGNMYDPLVVDTFLQVHKRLSNDSPSMAHEAPAAIVELTRRIADNRPIESTVSNFWTAERSSELLSISRLSTSLVGIVALHDAMKILSVHIHNLIPADLQILLVHDAVSDRLTVRYVQGIGEGIVKNWSLAKGERLSGWVAANKRSAVNSSPALDFDFDKSTALAGLRSAMVVPVINDDQLVGVLSFYSTATDAYDQSHRMLAELVAGHVAWLVNHAQQVSWTTNVECLPTAQDIEILHQRQLETDPESNRCAVLVVKAGDRYTTSFPYLSLIRRYLRASDLVFRISDCEVGCLLNRTDSETATRVLSRLHLELSSISFVAPGVTVGVAAMPVDGTTLHQAVVIARQRTQQSAAAMTRSVH
jgi:putative nucleotidyltransferase with HDIG domain